MKNFVVAIAVLIFGFSSALKAVDDEEKSLAHRKDYPIQLFLKICVVGNADESAVEKQSIKMGFKEVSNERAKKYLGNHLGKVFFIENEKGSFAVTVFNNGLCSIFIHQGDVISMQTSMEAWLPPKDTGFTYTADVVSDTETLKTTTYTIHKGSALFERWAISIAKKSDREVKVVMSYSSPAP